MRHQLALVACLAFTGSFADAAPGRHARHGKATKIKPKHRVKVAPPVEQPDDEEVDDDDDDDEDEEDVDSERVAYREASSADEDDADDDEDEAGDPPVRVREQAGSKARAKDWHVAIGPYLWASAVDADISLGSASVSTGVDFFDIKRHAKYGIELLAEARYGRFSIYGDLMYGVVGVDGATEVGPLMVTLDGTASSLLVDGVAGYTLVGGEQSVLSLEARAGVRYQRTAISGSVNVAGADVSPSAHVDAAADVLAGAHAVVRPHRRFYISGTADLGVAGASTSTWSASADAGVRITSRVRLSLGWRTLTTARTNVSIVMHGPRAALQLMF